MKLWAGERREVKREAPREGYERENCREEEKGRRESSSDRWTR